MLEKERLERELEHLKKAYRTGIIDDDEFEIAKNKIAAKMTKHTDAQTKYEESKKAISDMLDKKEDVKVVEEYSDDSYVQIFDEPAAEKVNSEENKIEEHSIKKKNKPTEEKDEGEWPTYDSMIIQKKKEDEEEISNKEEKQEEENKASDNEEKDDDGLDEKEDKYTPKKAENRRRKFAKKWNIEKPSHAKKEEKNLKKKVLHNGKSEKKEEKEDDREKTIGTGLKAILLIGLVIVFAFVAIKIYTNYFKETAPIVPMVKNLTNAKSTAVVEFFYSYSCKPCYESFKTVQDINKMYQGKVSIIYWHFPLDVESDVMMDTAADCAAEENAFFEYSDQLFKARKPLTTEGLITLTELAGKIDAAQFRACLENKTKRAEIASQYKIFIEQEQIESLPTIKINGAAVAGAKPLEFYEAIIDSEIELNAQIAPESINTTDIIVELNNINTNNTENQNNTFNVNMFNISADNTNTSILSDNKTTNDLNFVIE